jgi:uroporphyrin-3 C-methyltransferase/uroporphyrinogen III methyltransferase/synthase
MNDTPPSTASDVPPPAPTAPARPAGLTLRLWHVLLAALVAGAALLWQLRTAQQLQAVQADQAQRAAQWNDTLGATQRDLAEARKKLAALEEQLDGVKNQRADLEQLVVEITRGRDEALLIEVERLIVAAANELQLSGNVPAALVARQAADSRLARADRAPLVALRRTLGRDLERLRALPAIDVTGIALRLDQIAVGVDTWPMLADPAVPARKDEIKPPPSPRPASAAAKAAPPAVAAKTETEATDFWVEVRAWLREQFGDLVRIREVATPESVLLSANQQQLVRQQLRLRLFDARQALIARNDKLYRADLQEARVLLLRYFDLKQSGPAGALAQIDKLAATALSVEIPNAGLPDVLAAVRAARVPAVRQP